MQQSEPRIVFDDEEIRVIWHPGKADFLLITFGDLITHVDGNRFFADGPAGKAELPCLGIIVKKASWYPQKSLRAAHQTVLPFLNAYQTRITYGGSMGGYAAIKFSRLFAATEVISLCPQWSIDRAECEGHDPGWGDYYHVSMAGMGIRADDISGSVFIFADKSDKLDAFHLRMIQLACPTATAINVPMVSHHVTAVFAGTQNLLRLIDACRSNKPSDLVTIARALRKDSDYRWEILVTKAIGRFPRLICAALAKRSRRDPRAIALGARHLFRAADGLVRSGNSKAAADYIRAFRGGLDDPQSQMMAAAILGSLSDRAARIVTHHGTTLIYDFLQRVAIHTAPGADDPTVVQRVVHLDLAGDRACLSVDTAGGRIYLGLDNDGHLVDNFECEATDGPPRFTVVSPEAGRFTLSFSGMFLCAEPGGKVVCNRRVADDWERFSIH